MQTAMIAEITECLHKLPTEKLAVVYDFVSYLLDRETGQLQDQFSEAFHTMLASEAVLRRDWNRRGILVSKQAGRRCWSGLLSG